MNVTLVAGTVLLIIGLVAAAFGIAQIGQREIGDQSPVAVEQNQTPLPSEETASPAFAWLAGLALAAGGALIGIGMGHFRHPRPAGGHRPDLPESR